MDKQYQFNQYQKDLLNRVNLFIKSREKNNTIMGTLLCKKCGSIDDVHIKNNPPHYTAYCKCGAYIKHTGANPNAPMNTQSDNAHLKNYIGKYKGLLISEISDESWITWVLANNDTMNYKYRQAFSDRLQELKYKLD
jgi:hypothetical protein